MSKSKMARTKSITLSDDEITVLREALDYWDDYRSDDSYDHETAYGTSMSEELEIITDLQERLAGL